MDNPESRENEIQASAPQPKRAWCAPTIEEVDYTATEAAGIPGAAYDGLGFYSIV